MTIQASLTTHVDTFARDNLPPVEDWPVFDYSLPGGGLLEYPEQLNAAVELLDRVVAEHGAGRPAIHFQGRTVTYGELLEMANRIAHVLVDDLGLIPGNRVLLHGPNTPKLVACWFAILKAGGIVVTTMPLLRSRELRYTLEKARISLALSDSRVGTELYIAVQAIEQSDAGLRPRVVPFGVVGDPHELDARGIGKPATFQNVVTGRNDVALIAFTSGTTGRPKGTMHFHRDVLAICDCFPRYVLKPERDDVFTGTPPLAFTFGLGGLVLFPFRVGASTVLIEQPNPRLLLEAIQANRVTTLFTAPTMYRNLTGMLGDYNISSLRRCVSAGEPLPPATYDGWLAATGIKIIDGIGATEMLHIFISASDDDIRPGSTGRAVPGYQATVLDEQGNELPPDTVGRLAVRGVTGCRYLGDPERQRIYVQGGWNITGDAYKRDADGYFWFQARTDDMILSSGYNIAGPEVENVLLEHPSVQECAVVGVPDPQRTNVVKAFIVLRDPATASPGLVAELQEFVKSQIAPYKYPRQIEFVDALPRTETGKLQRFRLREGA